MNIFTFDKIFHSCVIGNKRREYNDTEIQLNSFLRACHNYYRIYAGYGCLHEYEDRAEDMGWEKDYLLYLYNDRLSKEGTTSRKYYNLLKAYSIDNKCALCHIRDADSLDHFLPKEYFPSLTISSNNLIPSCDKCNRKKLAYYAEKRNAQLIHPRFEDFYNKFWMAAYFDEKDNRVVMSPNDKIYPKGSDEYNRIETHIGRLGIATAYELNAMRQVKKIVRATRTNRHLSLKTSILKEVETLNENLKECPESKFTFDMWKWITCNALLSSEYFLSEGCRLFSNAPVITRPNYSFV